VVHCHGEEGALIPALSGRSFRLIVTPRYPSYPAALAKGGLHSLAAHPKYHALGRLIRGADLCCPASRTSAALVARAYGIGEQTMLVVHNGVRRAFLDVERSADARRGPLVFFGRVERSKGVDTLIDALALMGRKAPSAVIVGRGSAEIEARAKVAALGLANRVSFLGWQGDAALAQLLAVARLAVLPSREESFGNTVVEAMAAGVPLVSTTAGSIPEIVEQNTTGLLVAAGDPQALAQAIAETLDDDEGAARRALTARRIVADRYSWDAAAARFEETYAEDLAAVQSVASPMHRGVAC
jgi:glycosyltransferase involved in cell wall biosynthesis